MVGSLYDNRIPDKYNIIASGILSGTDKPLFGGWGGEGRGQVTLHCFVILVDYVWFLCQKQIDLLHHPLEIILQAQFQLQLVRTMKKE